jgi:hypothetical protein
MQGLGPHACSIRSAARGLANSGKIRPLKVERDFYGGATQLTCNFQIRPATIASKRMPSTQSPHFRVYTLTGLLGDTSESTRLTRFRHPFSRIAAAQNERANPYCSASQVAQYRASGKAMRQRSRGSDKQASGLPRGGNGKARGASRKLGRRN